MSLIKPTVGRVVWFYPNGSSDIDARMQPLSAQIAFVHTDSLINIGYLDANGNARNATSVYMVSPDTPVPSSMCCTWMPFQVGQARQQQPEQARDEAKAEPSALELGAAARAAGPAEKY